jgi:iron complex transport system substrate-binding protein
MWGRITGNPKAAERVIQEFQTRLDAVLKKLGSLKQGPRVFHDDSSFYTTGPDTVLGQVYTLLKGENIARDVSGFGQLSPEAIVERDPQVVVATFPDLVQEYLKNPAFKGVSAVKNNRVVSIQPDGILSVFGTRFVEGIESLAKILHPDLFGTYGGY